MNYGNNIPIGGIVIYAGTKLPTTTNVEWRFCDGSLLEKTEEYREISELLGHRFDAEPETNHVRLPDFRGYFLRGATQSSNEEPSKKDPDALNRKAFGGHKPEHVGSEQHAIVGRHIHMSHEGDTLTADGALVTGHPICSQDTLKGNQNSLKDASRLDEDTRPINIAVNYIIRVK